jgi:hypothetical protein
MTHRRLIVHRQGTTRFLPKPEHDLPDPLIQGLFETSARSVLLPCRALFVGSREAPRPEGHRHRFQGNPLFAAERIK